MAALKATAGVAARRSPLTREAIVHAAIGYVDREGLTALTMRRLGRELGVEAMSLYRYVASREDLLEAMIDELITSMQLDRAQSRPHETWQAYLAWLATAARDLAVQHPQIFPLIATRHPSAPWLRPPLRSLAVVEDFLHTLTRAGFSDEAAVDAYRSFSTFLLGQLLIDSGQRSRQPTLAEEQLESAEQNEESLSDFPTVARLQEQLSADDGGVEFEVGLDELIDRLSRSASSP